jgi:hypothetical protein
LFDLKHIIIFFNPSIYKIYKNEKVSKLLVIALIFILLMVSQSAFAQTANNNKMVQIYLKNNSLLPKGVGIKEIKPNVPITNAYIGSWMPFSSKLWEVPVGTRLEYIADKSVIMAGNAAKVQGKLIVEVKVTDEGKTFTF